MEEIKRDTLKGEELEDKKELVPVKDVKDLDFLRKYYPEKFFENYKLSKQQVQELVAKVSTYSTGLYGPIAVVCAGPKCTLRGSCPLDKSGVAPVGHPCPLELMAAEHLTKQYITALKIDVNNQEEMDKVRELVECDIYDKFRTEAVLNKAMTAFEEESERFDPTSGQVIERRKEVAKALDVKFRFKKRRDQIMNDLLGTRQIKAKYKIKKESDPSKVMSALIHKLEEAEIVEDTKKDTKDDIKKEDES